MGIWDTLTTQKDSSQVQPKAPDSIWGDLGTPKPDIAPRLTSALPTGGMGQSTPQISKPGTPDIANWLFNPHAETKIQPLGFTPEQAPTFTGPRAIFGPVKLIEDFFSGFLKGAAQGASDVYKLVAPKNAPANNVTLPKQVSGGFLPEGATDQSGKILSAAQRTLARQKELDADTPATPGLNAAQAIFEVGLPASFNVLFAGDIAKGVTQDFLQNTNFQSVLGLKYSTLGKVPTEDFVKTVSNRTREVVRGVAEDLKSGKITQMEAQKKMAEIGNEYHTLGDLYKSQKSIKLNKVGQLFENTSIALNEDISNLGRDTSPIEGTVRPADETLPGYRTRPGQAPAFGMSTEEIQPVGFHDYQEPSIDIGENGNATTPQKSIWDGLTDSKGKVVGTAKVGDKEISIAKGGGVEIPQLETAPLFDKQQTAPVYQGEKDLSIKTLEKLKGRSTVSKKFIENLTNQPELKQQERDAVRAALADYPDGSQIPIAEFAKKVTAELLPLKRLTNTSPQYESISLGGYERGDIANYSEHIYSSPVKNSAGGVHFGRQENTSGYFGHTRVEDMANKPSESFNRSDLNTPEKIKDFSNGIRRVIEVQSDLYQKGGLERQKVAAEMDAAGKGGAKEINAVGKNFKKLDQYNDPTAHFRMVREEVAQAAKDGKTKLQFPTGETAMKIEGLGQIANWVYKSDVPRSVNINGRNITAETPWEKLKPEDLKVGQSVKNNNAHGDWIVTDVLGDGKFKAVSKHQVDEAGGFDLWLKKVNGDITVPHGEFRPSRYVEETFDISGKVDTNNPIYKFYEKDLGRYLKSKYGAETVTDKQGVTWYEVPVSQEMAGKPVEAFKKGSSKFDLPKTEAEKIFRKFFDKHEVDFMTSRNLGENTLGKFTKEKGLFSNNYKSMVKVLEAGGKVSEATIYHEAFHAFFNNFVTEAERKIVLDKVMNNKLAFAQKLYNKSVYTSAQTRAEEWLADDFAKYMKGPKEYKGFFRRLWQKLIAKLRDLIRKASGAQKIYDDIIARTRPGEAVPGEFARASTDENLPEEIQKAEREEQRPQKSKYSDEGIPLSTSKMEAEISLRSPIALSPELEQRRTEVENLTNVLENSPYNNPNARLLFDREGGVRELGDIKSPNVIKKVEDMMAEAGVSDPHEFSAGYEKYLEQRRELKTLRSEFARDRQEFLGNVRGEKNFFIDERRARAEIAERANQEKMRDELLKAAKKRKAIEQANKYSSVEKDNPYQAARHAFSPLSALDERTKDILREWNYKRVAGQELANIEAHKLSAYEKDGMGIVHKFESGESMPERGAIQKVFNDLWLESNKRGGSVGIHPEYLPRYVPHVYKGGRAEQRLAILDYLIKEKGMTAEEATDYMNEVKQLNADQSRRLKLTPTFVKERIFPTYASAMKYGLKPRYSNIGDLAGYYRQQMENAIAGRELLTQLDDEAKILPDVSAPDNWSKLNKQFSPSTTYEAPKALAKVINNMFPDTEMLGAWPKVLKGVAWASRIAQEIALSAGFPRSSVNFYTIGQTIKEMTAGNFKAPIALVRSNSLDATEKYFLEHKDDLLAMAQQGIHVASHIGKFGDTKFSEMVKDKNIKSAIGVGADKLFNQKTFESFMPMIETQLFADVKNKAIEQGMEKGDAEKLAGDTVKMNFGMNSDDFARGQTLNDAMSAVFFAPRFRETVINSLINTGEAGYELAKYFVTGGKSALNPTLGRNRRLLFGMLLTFAAYNLLNKKINGNWMWENPSGHEFDLRIPYGSNGDVAYTSFMPSYLSTARNLGSLALAIPRGDFKTAGQKLGSLFSMPLRTASEMLTNSDYFNRPIYNDTDKTSTKLGKLAGYAGLQIMHPYMKELVNQIEKKNPLYQSVVYALEFPLKFSTQSKESTSAYYDMKDSQDVKNSQAKQDFQPVFNAIQKLIQDGHADEAQEHVDALSDTDYEMYKNMRTALKSKTTSALKTAMFGTYTKVQKLIQEGETEQAQAIVDDMTDVEYKAYQSLKKQFNG